MKSRILVDLPQRPYEVINASGSIDLIGSFLVELEKESQDIGERILLVSNPIVFQHYGQRVASSLMQEGFRVSYCLLPAGEQHKTLDSVQKIYGAALEGHLERSSTILALGGGIVGDMAGFAAATWLRGINFIQVPTSLLSMVDASIGGKTGVNHPFGKNLIGAFHQPRVVVIDPEVLGTLPDREFRAGVAEIIKYGVIWDAVLFEQLEEISELQHYHSVKPEILQRVIARSCQAKAEIVAQDERETGIRAILNYGHTIGHAIESLTKYRLLNHGEAVALGMIAAGEIAGSTGRWTNQEIQKQLALIKKAGLPTQLPDSFSVETEEVLESLLLDKKVKKGQVRFILPTGIGAAEIANHVPAHSIVQALSTLNIRISSSDQNVGVSSTSTLPSTAATYQAIT